MSKLFADWMLDCRSRIIYERKRDSQVFYVLPVASILGKLSVVPIGDTGTIPFAMRQNARDFVDAAFDTSEGLGRQPMVVHQHVGFELVPRTLRDLKKRPLHCGHCLRTEYGY